MESKYRNIIDRVIKNNCYFAHPENVLLAMITHDNSSNICSLGLSRIMKARSAFSVELRRLSLPSIYPQNTPITGPPAMKRSALHHHKQRKPLHVFC